LRSSAIYRDERRTTEKLELSLPSDSLVIGIRDEAGIKKIAYDVDLASSRSAALKAAGKYHFAENWARKIGTDFPLNCKAVNCPGEISNCSG
jgi:hypothetical protein